MCRKSILSTEKYVVSYQNFHPMFYFNMSEFDAFNTPTLLSDISFLVLELHTLTNKAFFLQDQL